MGARAGSTAARSESMANDVKLLLVDDNPMVLAMLEHALVSFARVVAAGKKTGTPTGMHTMDPEAALRRAEQGMQFIAIGSELRFMTQKAQETLRAIQPESAEKELARY